MLKHVVKYYDKGKTKIWYEYWLLNEEAHREDGPAYIEYNEDGSIYRKAYYIKGFVYTEQEWFDTLSIKQKVDYLLRG